MAAKRRKRGTSQRGTSEVLCVGIDLGTSRSAVSAANGNRELVESYVGWPRDFVAQKMLGRPVLFGEDALRHRLSLDLVRPLAAGVIKDTTEREEEAVRELAGHLVELAGASPGQKIHAAVGIPAEALKVNCDAIREAISQFTDKLILVSEPFSVAYGLGPGMMDNTMVVDIGAGTVDFCIMHGTEPEGKDQRSLVTAGDSVDEALLGALQENYPDSDFTLSLVRRFKEQYGFVGAARRKVVVEVPVKGRMMSHDITEEMRRACETIMAPVAETILDMIGRLDPEFQEQVRSNILLAGGGSQIAGIGDFLQEALRESAECRVSTVDDPVFAGADGALELARDAPQERWDRD